MTDTVQAEIIDGTTGELVPYQTPNPVGLFGTNEPAEVVNAARRAALPLVDVIRSQKLSVKIGPSEHVRVEGWTLLGSMLGVFPVCVWTRPLEDGWEARVEARTRAGEVVGAAESECLRSEKTWANRDDYALRSMAQTRATSKALRQPLGFVMQLAGFNPTPAEEMPREPRKRSSQNTELPGETFEDAFGGDPADPADGKVSLSDSQKKKLDVLVGQLRESGRLHTEHLFAAVGRMRDVDPEDLARAMPGAVDGEGVLHYSPLRDTLSKAEASNLIDRLSKLQEAT